MTRYLKEYKDFTAYRNVWMGFAILGVMCYHYEAQSIPIINRLFAIGYGGVDIFFFSSGIGCWYSLNKSSSSTSFLKRRASRIFPTYIPFIIVFLIVTRIFNGPIQLNEIFGNIFCTGSFLGMENQFNWYLGGLLVFYLIAPVLVDFVNRNVEKKLNLILLFVFLVVFSLCFVTYESVIIVFSRMPIAYLGIVSAALGNNGKNFNLKNVLIMLGLSAVGVVWLVVNCKFFPDLLWSYALYWYPFILITPGLCYSISLIAKRFKFFNITLGFIGKYSFELFLQHMLLLLISDYLISAEYVTGRACTILRIAALVLSFVFAFIMKKAVNGLTSSSKKLLNRISTKENHNSEAKIDDNRCI